MALYEMDFGMLPVLNEGDECITLAKILTTRNTALVEEELWSMCQQTCLALQNLCSTSETFQRLCVTPDSLAFDTSGSVCFLELDVDPEELFIPPEYEALGNSFKAHIYSLGMSLLFAAQLNVNEECSDRLGESLKTLLGHMTVEDYGDRIDLEEVLNSCSRQLQDTDWKKVFHNLATTTQRPSVEDQSSDPLTVSSIELARSECLHLAEHDVHSTPMSNLRGIKHAEDDGLHLDTLSMSTISACEDTEDVFASRLLAVTDYTKSEKSIINMDSPSAKTGISEKYSGLESKENRLGGMSDEFSSGSLTSVSDVNQVNGVTSEVGSQCKSRSSSESPQALTDKSSFSLSDHAFSRAQICKEDLSQSNSPGANSAVSLKQPDPSGVNKLNKPSKCNLANGKNPSDSSGPPENQFSANLKSESVKHEVELTLSKGTSESSHQGSGKTDDMTANRIKCNRNDQKALTDQSTDLSKEQDQGDMELKKGDTEMKGLTVQGILEKLGCALKENELWALCKVCVEKIQDLNKQDLPELICLETVLLDTEGHVRYIPAPNGHVMSSFFIAPELEQKGLITEQTCLFAIAAVVWCAADYRMPVTQEPVLMPAFEKLLTSMTQEDPRGRPALSDVVKVCNKHFEGNVSSASKVCQALVREAQQAEVYGRKNVSERKLSKPVTPKSQHDQLLEDIRLKKKCLEKSLRSKGQDANETPGSSPDLMSSIDSTLSNKSLNTDSVRSSLPSTSTPVTVPSTKHAAAVPTKKPVGEGQSQTHFKPVQCGESFKKGQSSKIVKGQRLTPEKQEENVISKVQELKEKLFKSHLSGGIVKELEKEIQNEGKVDTVSSGLPVSASKEREKLAEENRLLKQVFNNNIGDKVGTGPEQDHVVPSVGHPPGRQGMRSEELHSVTPGDHLPDQSGRASNQVHAEPPGGNMPSAGHIVNVPLTPTFHFPLSAPPTPAPMYQMPVQIHQDPRSGILQFVPVAFPSIPVPVQTSQVPSYLVGQTPTPPNVQAQGSPSFTVPETPGYSLVHHHIPNLAYLPGTPRLSDTRYIDDNSQIKMKRSRSVTDKLVEGADRNYTVKAVDLESSFSNTPGTVSDDLLSTCTLKAAKSVPNVFLAHQRECCDTASAKPQRPHSSGSGKFGQSKHTEQTRNLPRHLKSTHSPTVSPPVSKDSGLDSWNNKGRRTTDATLMDRLLNPETLQFQQKISKVVQLVRDEFAYDGYLENGVEDLAMAEFIVSLAGLKNDTFSSVIQEKYHDLYWQDDLLDQLYLAVRDPEPDTDKDQSSVGDTSSDDCSTSKASGTKDHEHSHVSYRHEPKDTVQITPRQKAKEISRIHHHKSAPDEQNDGKENTDNMVVTETDIESDANNEGAFKTSTLKSACKEVHKSEREKLKTEGTSPLSKRMLNLSVYTDSDSTETDEPMQEPKKSLSKAKSVSLHNIFMTTELSTIDKCSEIDKRGFDETAKNSGPKLIYVRNKEDISAGPVKLKKNRIPVRDSDSTSHGYSSDSSSSVSGNKSCSDIQTVKRIPASGAKRYCGPDDASGAICGLSNRLRPARSESFLDKLDESSSERPSRTGSSASLVSSYMKYSQTSVVMYYHIHRKLAAAVKEMLTNLDTTSVDALEAKMAELKQQIKMELKMKKKTSRYYQKLTALSKTSKGGSDPKNMVSRVQKQLAEMDLKLDQLYGAEKEVMMLYGRLWGLEQDDLYSFITSPRDQPLQIFPCDNELLQFQQLPDHSCGVLQAGKPEGLMGYLYAQDAISEGYIHQFFYCYRYFVTPKELMAFIQDRFMCSCFDVYGSCSTKVRRRSLHLLQTWIEGYYSVDLKYEPEKVFDLEHFIRKKVLPVEACRAEYLLQLLWDCKAEKHQDLQFPNISRRQGLLDARAERQIPKKWETFRAAMQLSRKPVKLGYQAKCRIPCCESQGRAMQEAEYFPKLTVRKSETFTLTDYTSQLLAEQLTLIQQSIYQKAHPVLYLNSRTQGISVTLTQPVLDHTQSVQRLNAIEDHPDHSLFVKNPVHDDIIQKMIEHAHWLSHWVSAEILSCSLPKVQVAIVTKFIYTAKICQEIRDYATCIAIVEGLDNLIVRHLPVWRNLPSKCLSMMEEMTSMKLFLKSDEMCLYDEACWDRPTIPSILLFLLHVQQAEIGGFTLANGMIKWNKMRDITRVLDQIRLFKQHQYDFDSDPELQATLKFRIKQFSEHDLQFYASHQEPNSPKVSRRFFHNTFQRVRRKFRGRNSP